MTNNVWCATSHSLPEDEIKMVYGDNDWYIEFTFCWKDTPAKILEYFTIEDDKVKEWFIHVTDAYCNATTNKSFDPSSLARLLPGVDNIVKNPIDGTEARLWGIVIYLNDIERWTREQIADWIETLDEVPSFEVKDETELFKTPSLVAYKRILPC